MPDAGRVLIVQEHRRTVVRADLMERVPSEVLVAHDVLVSELVDGFFHPFEITLELFFRRFPPLVEQVLPIVRVNGGCGR
jgi:hypothetical protein